MDPRADDRLIGADTGAADVLAMLRAAHARGDGSLREAVEGPYRDWIKARIRTAHTDEDRLRLADELEQLAPPGLLADVTTGLRSDVRHERRDRLLRRISTGLLFAGVAGMVATASVPAAVVAACIVVSVLNVAKLLQVVNRHERQRRDRAAAHLPQLAAAQAGVLTFMDRCAPLPPHPAALNMAPLQRRTRARGRARRHGARRAAGVRSGNDPGDEGPSSSSPSRKRGTP
jgi:hypothetical protein